jgi:hypothetical protein
MPASDETAGKGIWAADQHQATKVRELLATTQATKRGATSAVS